MLPSLLLCLLWPYFNIIDLFTGDNAIFHQDRKYYIKISLEKVGRLQRRCPALIFFKKDRVFNFLSLSIGIMLVVYVAGDLTGKHGLSRLLSPDNDICSASSLVIFFSTCLRQTEIS
jgi:hypothetical protein